jgi:hypothetical protein
MRRQAVETELQLENRKIGVRCIAGARAEAGDESFAGRFEPCPEERDAILRGCDADAMAFLFAQEGRIDDGGVAGGERGRGLILQGGVDPRRGRVVIGGWRQLRLRLRRTSLRMTRAPGAGLKSAASARASVDFPVPLRPLNAAATCERIAARTDMNSGSAGRPSRSGVKSR